MSTDLQLRGRFLRLLGRFARSKGGNVALIFAVTLIPMLAATGMVVDYTRAAKAKQQLQDALDSTALFLSKNSSVSTMNSATLLQTAQNYVNVNFTNTDVNGTAISPSYSSSGPSVTVSGTTNSPCAFMSVLGIRSIPVSGTSTAVWGHERLRVALVLDNTGSMNDDGKITALRTATTNLLTQLQNAASVNGDVYVSIIPFVKDVDVGSSNYTFNDTGCPSATSVACDGIAFDDVSCNPSQSTCDGWWDGSNGTCNKSAGYHQSNSPRSNCLALGSCSITGQGYSTCTSTSGCFVSGTYTSSRTTSSACTSSGTCSGGGYTTQSTCTAPGTCTISSKTTSSTCTGTSGCFLNGAYTSTYTTSTACSNANNKCTITGKSQFNCTSTSGCFINGTYNSSYTTSSTCRSHSGTWTSGTWNTTTWAAGQWTATYTWTAQTAGTWSAGVWSATWTPYAHNDSHHGWNGCVTDRGASPFSVGTGVDAGPGTGSGNDQLTTTPTSTDVSTLFPAEQYSSCNTLQAMMGLNYNWSTMSTMVSNMTAGGSTNQPIGLVWGWQSLVGGGPFTVPAFDSSYQYKQVIILLSDGLNTQDRWYGNGSATSTSVDYRMQYGSGSSATGTCVNAKAQGIIIYTVQVNTGGDPTSTLLQNCATDSSKFFLLTSASQIITTFQSIGTALSDLRLSI